MHPLIASLAAWPGRQATKSRLQAKGYWLPERYKEIVLANCGDCDATSVERYWDELALEYLCAAGRVHAIRRVFGGETSYRSDYLDGLASLPENRNAASAGLPLDACLQVFTTKSRSLIAPGILLAHRIAEQMEAHKRAEIQSFGISADEWTGAKGDLANFLRQAAEPRGFVLRRKMWRKVFGEVLEFCCGIDSGGERLGRFIFLSCFRSYTSRRPI